MITINIGERIKQRRKQLKLSADQLAEKLGKNRATVYRYESEDIENMPYTVIQSLAEALNVSPAYLMGWEEINPKQLATNYPFLPASISAGLPIDVQAITVADKIEMPDSIMGKWAGDKEISIMRINGDSMDKIMPDNSLIAMKPIAVNSLKNGDIVVFSNGHEYSVKRYFRIGDKLIFRPESNNAAHFEQHYSLEDNIVIHGKVVVYIVELD